jgi:hypothetical protein
MISDGIDCSSWDVNDYNQLFNAQLEKCLGGQWKRDSFSRDDLTTMRFQFCCSKYFDESEDPKFEKCFCKCRIELDVGTKMAKIFHNGILHNHEIN